MAGKTITTQPDETHQETTPSSCWRASFSKPEGEALMFSRISFAAALAILALGLLSARTSRAQNEAAVIYKANCALCHGPDGNSLTGKALGAKDLRADALRKQSNAELAALISAGRNKMPAFGKKLKPEDTRKLVAYVKALPK
jgi:mono/diheme cytochrome c family protein